MSTDSANEQKRASTTVRPTARLRVLVPDADNDGVPFSPQQYAQFEAFAVGLAGGVTELGRARGLWQADGQVFSDTHRDYEIIVPRRRVRGVAAAVVEHVRTEFRQLAVFVEITPVRVTGF